MWHAQVLVEEWGREGGKGGEEGGEGGLLDGHVKLD